MCCLAVNCQTHLELSRQSVLAETQRTEKRACTRRPQRLHVSAGRRESILSDRISTRQIPRLLHPIAWELRCLRLTCCTAAKWDYGREQQSTRCLSRPCQGWDCVARVQTSGAQWWGDGDIDAKMLTRPPLNLWLVSVLWWLEITFFFKTQKGFFSSAKKKISVFICRK